MRHPWIGCVVLGALMSSPSMAESHREGEVMIAGTTKSVHVSLGGEDCVIARDQSKNHPVHPMYITTTRGKIQPMQLGLGIETIGELEFIDWMQRAQSDSSIMIVDTRTPGWHANLRIPCSFNVPFTDFADQYDDGLFHLTETFGVIEKENGELDFSKAKTIVGYCNGYWCGQTPNMYVRAKYSLINLGYPADKLKYYRGGMQAWTSLGLTVVGSQQ
ncbi:MAG: rhodanese-like domain-containing protein [Proteobacteria bacterium]|nr:rhodanese-like domain-containing protein [Pseudomonadota bacterium]